MSDEQLAGEAHLFPVRDALWYIPRSSIGFGAPQANQGSGYYVAPNPDYGAVFTVFQKEAKLSLKKQRKKAEKDALNNNQVLKPKTWEELDAEASEEKDQFYLAIRAVSYTHLTLPTICSV